MRDELQRDADAFEQLDRDVNVAMLPARKRLGINDKKFEEQTKKIMQQMIAEKPWEE
jgi:hypothetical protein